MHRPFLSARWTNLALVTYRVSPDLLVAHMPPGCQPDLLEGQAFVSLVAFDFRDTRVLGIRWPGHVDFPEINLRFYVRFQGTRGVCFIRELVPRRLIACLARSLYNEPYRSVPMQSRAVENDEGIWIQHQVEIDGRQHRLEMTAANPCGFHRLTAPSSSSKSIPTASVGRVTATLSATKSVTLSGAHIEIR